MALTYDQITAITRKKFIPKLYDNIFDSNPYLQRIKKKSYVKKDGGERIMVPLLYATTSASGWYADGDTLSTTDNEQMTAAEYLWKMLYANVTIPRLSELKNSGDSQVISLVKSKTQAAEKTMADTMGTGLYNAGSTVNAIGGLRHLLSTSNTVGGISQSSYSWWQAQVDSTTTTLSLSVMQTQDNACTIGSESPTVIFTTRSLYNSYYALLQPQQRFVDSETAKGGFTSIMFNGKPVIPDSHCPSSHMFHINEDHMKLCVHKDEDFRTEPFMKPINQNVKVMKIYWAGNLTSSNNRLHSILSALTA